jgi:group I intron endonuclease
MKSGVYQIKCIANSKIYIGSSQNIEKRINHHFTTLSRNKHKNPHLQSAYNKYGEDNFEWSVVEYCSVDQLLIIEQKWMDTTLCYERNIGFNNTKKSDRPEGYKHTEENKKIMSKIKKGKKQSKETIKKRVDKLKGQKRTDECKKRMSEAKIGKKNPMFGKKENEEHKQKRMKNMLSKPRWNKGLTIADDPRIKKLAVWKDKIPPNALKCKLIDNDTGEYWRGDSLKDLSKKTPISLSSINRLQSKTAGIKLTKKYKLIINEK